MSRLIESGTLASLTRQLFRLPYACGVRSLILRLQREDLERCQKSGRREAQIQLPGGRQQMIVDRADRIGSLFFWLGRHHRQQIGLAERLLPHNGVFIDVGANIGEFTLSLALSRPKSRIIAVEPNPVIRRSLERNLVLNSISNVECFPFALSNESGRRILYQCDDSSLTSLLPITASHVATDEVELCSLDGFAQSQQLNRLDLLKIDVEGYELNVLSGARASLEKFRPSMILEINSLTSKAAGFEVAELLELLRLHRYKFFAWKGRRWTTAGNDIPTHGDLWAEPEERAVRIPQS